MASQMELAELELVDREHPNSQTVAVLEAPYDISIAYAKIPKPNRDEICIQIKYVGICGSDLETYRGSRKPEYLSMPTRLGHEVSGIVCEVGENVKGLQIGDKVACRYVWGAFAEYIVCKPFNVIKLPLSFPMKEISLIEVLPGIIHTAELAEITENKNVLIMGQGVSGLIMTQVISLYNPKNLVVTDLNIKKLKLAQSYGATHTFKIPNEYTSTMDIVGEVFPEGFDIVIPCLLDGDGMVDAIDTVAFSGKIVMYGCIGICNKSIDFFKVHRKRINIYSTEPRTDNQMRKYFHEGVQLVLDGLINTSEMVTNIFSLADLKKAFELRDNKNDKEAIHVLIDCDMKNKKEF
ncbi:alcohol dehydrogenase catalytic domain-containing protein [Tamlana fucoidanivorans]|uniref:Zinc-binding dehydrogenase n=1 Tax=Allotamlana fucoidanivorans TaxID=2583814 RepID=A0A5C4SP43_9FLAO|nr:alcohol dehydrogenase catalytic domain-containing protein [Tamlana fucoidanivorans]TNJ46042.1 zinc-binding dehydrogenase [Tamlana fucoidanivorans]